MARIETSEVDQWRPGARLLNGLSTAAFVIGRDSSLMYANGSAASWFGPGMVGKAGSDVLGQLFPQASSVTVADVLAQVLAGDSWTGELPVLGADGAGHLTETSWSPAYDGRTPVGAVVLVEGAEGGAAYARRVALRLQRIATVTAELVVATDLAGVTEVVIDHLADATGATVSSLSVLVEPGTLALVGMRGGKEGAASRWATYPVQASTPAGDTLRRGQPLVLVGCDEIDRAYPDLERAADGERTLVCLPLKVTGRDIGVVSLSFSGRRAFDPTELDFLVLLANTCSQALDRISAVADVADREAKLRFLSEASVELASSLDYEATLRAVAHLAVPQFADWCVIELLEDGILRPLAVAHPNELTEARIAELQEQYPPDPGAQRGSYHVARTGEPELVPEISDDMLVAAARDGNHLQVLRDLHFRSALQVPLVAHTKVLGVITWVAGEDGRRFTVDDLAFGQDLARRAAVAIDNSQLHSQIRDVAVRLQHAVLPASLPAASGWDVAACYLPAGRAEVGGDFYDAVPLADGRIALFVGDVMGRGVAAAAAMAQMRSALLTLIALDPDPDAVMAGLDLVFARYDYERLVTVVYAVVDPARNLVQLINAGHPAPVVVTRAGESFDVTTDDALLLGAGGATRAVLTRPLHPGDTLLMFTDGLVERRCEHLDLGHRRVHDALPELGTPVLEEGLRALVDAVRDSTSDDDVAALALRRTR